MKLLLTSAGFENKNIEKVFLDLVNKKPELIKALFIPTAAIFPDAIAVLPECLNDLINAGISKENISVYDLHKNMSWEEICEYDALYFCGGDPKYLLDRIKENGFDILLRKYIDNGGVFVGVSAGSIITATNLQDNLGYINCKISVHCEKGTIPGEIDTSNFQHVLLTNNQAIVLTDDYLRVIE
jgi:peptidase E